MFVLQWYKTCLKYDVEVEDNPRTLEQQLLFQESQIFRRAMEELSLRMGLSGLMTLSK